MKLNLRNALDMLNLNPAPRDPHPWTILDKRMRPIVSFTSFIDLKIADKGSVATAAIEKGSFATYNKVQAPKELVATVAYQGTPDQINQVINRLEQLKAGIEVFSVVTPFQEYRWLTLKDMDYAHSQDSGSGILVTTLNMIEVREFESLYAQVAVPEKKTKNKENASRVKTGKKQGKTTARQPIKKVPLLKTVGSI